MNKEIKALWLKELKIFNKEPAFKKLKLPLKVFSSSGILASPAGILCDIHAKETGNKWKLFDTKESKWTTEIEKLANLYYLDEWQLIPKEVLEWAELGENILSYFYQIYDTDGFDGIIKMLEKPDNYHETLGSLFYNNFNGQKKTGKTKKIVVEEKEFDFDILLSDNTLLEADGDYLKVKEIIESEFPHPKVWNLKSNVQFESDGIACLFILDLNDKQDLVVTEYYPSVVDFLDFKRLNSWATKRNWKKPILTDALVKDNISYWRDRWESEDVDSSLLEKKYGPRKFLTTDEDEDDEDYV